MAIEFVCECGTVLHVPDTAAGKQGRCKACNRLMTVPTREQIAAREERALDPRYAFRGRDEGREAVKQPTHGFWADAARSFILDANPANLFPLAFLWILYGFLWLLGFAGCFGTVGRFFVAGWMCAFYLNVILETAGGEDDIPTLSLTEGAWDGIIVPFFTFLGSLLGVLAPALVCGILYLFTGHDVLGYVALGVAALGIFAWPAAILMVSIGGASAAFQLDLLVATILRSFGPYLAVLGLIVAAFGLETWLGMQLVGEDRRLPGPPSTGLGVAAFQALVHAYAMIVAMRSIGLYYRHFKHRFPWAAE